MKQEILSALGSHPWAEALIWYNCIDSTNDEAKRLAAKGAPHGTVLIADRQTKGRGRMGRTFQSPGGKGIYLSVILRPECKPDKLMHLTCAVAVAMCDAVEAVCGARPGVKWINDLILQKKKLGGILTEMSVAADGDVQYAVVGIGINCSQKEEDFPPELREIAVSLETALGKPVSRAALAAEMVRTLAQMSQDLQAKKYTLLDIYRSDCVTIGKEVMVHSSQESNRGYAVDVDSDGALVVRFSDGSIRAVQSGEVSVRGLYGYC